MGTHKATIEDYLTGVKVVEEEFGLKWLQRKAKATNGSGLRGQHPIPKDWKDAKEALEVFVNTRSLRVNRGLIALSSFAHDLRLGRSLPNYEIVIRPKLKKWKEFSKTQYEVYIGALCVQSGYYPQFIPPSTIAGERTADLKFLAQGLEVYVECVRKNAYLPRAIDFALWKSLSENLLALQRELAASHEIIVIALGALEERSFPGIIRIVRQNILHGSEGIWVNREMGFGTAIHKLPPSAPGESVGVIIPAGQNPAVAEATIAKDNQGRLYAKDPKRVALYVINSHKLSSIVQSFNDSRGQIPEGGIGLVYIDLDVAYVVETDVAAYLEIVTAALKTCFTSGTNTRIGAVAVTTAPLFIESGQDDNRTITLRRHVKLVRNPYRSLPDEVVVPGESL
jgi:hypothetical protein